MQGLAGLNVEISALFDEVRLTGRVQRQVDSAISRRLAPSFTPFDFIDTSELNLSRLLAWMLDSSGSHGQGRAYLDKLVAALGLTWSLGDAPSTVTLEEATSTIDRSGRRLDIVVRVSGHILGIENKPYTGYSEVQVSDYLSDLRKKAQFGTASRYCLACFQGWSGEIPGSQLTDAQVAADLAERRLVPIHYSRLAEWVELCAAETEPIVVQAFLRQMADIFQKRFGGGSIDVHRSALVDVILDSERSLQAALDVIASADDLLTAVAARFRQALSARLTDGMTMVDVAGRQSFDTVMKRQAGLDIDLGPDVPFTMGLIFDKPRYVGPYVGLAPREGTVRERAAVREELNKRGYALAADQWWIGWQWLHRLTQTQESEPQETWRMMADGRLADRVVEIAQRFRHDLTSMAVDRGA